MLFWHLAWSGLPHGYFTQKKSHKPNWRGSCAFGVVSFGKAIFCYAYLFRHTNVHMEQEDSDDDSDFAEFSSQSSTACAEPNEVLIVAFFPV